MFVKIGPRMKRYSFLPGGLVGLQDVRAGDVRRHQVGRELHAPELQVQHLGHRADEHRFRQAGHPDHQDVAVGNDRRQQLADDFRLPDDRLADLLRDEARFLAHGADHRLDACVGGSARSRGDASGAAERSARRGRCRATPPTAPSKSAS